MEAFLVPLTGLTQHGYIMTRTSDGIDDGKEVWGLMKDDTTLTFDGEAVLFGDWHMRLNFNNKHISIIYKPRQISLIVQEAS